MKNLRTILVALSALVLCGCSNDDNGQGGGGGGQGGGGDIQRSELIGKWEAGDNRLGIISVEFGVSGSYIVIADRELTKADDSEPTPDKIYFGTFTLKDKVVTLSGLGTMTIESISGDKIDFRIDTGDGAVAIKGDKTTEMPSTTKTDLLCRTWKVAAMEDNYDGEDEQTPEYVYFSKAGTYMVNFDDGTCGLSNWKWKSENEGLLYYSWEFPPQWEDQDVVKIESLTETELVIFEDESDVDGYYSRITLKPVSTTKISAAGSAQATIRTAGHGFWGI